MLIHTILQNGLQNLSSLSFMIIFTNKHNLNFLLVITTVTFTTKTSHQHLNSHKNNKRIFQCNITTFDVRKRGKVGHIKSIAIVTEYLCVQSTGKKFYDVIAVSSFFEFVGVFILRWSDCVLRFVRMR